MLAHCTDNFTREETEKLIEILNRKFGLKASIRKRIKENKEICYRIAINRKSVQRLRATVLPYMIDSMIYKIGL